MKKKPKPYNWDTKIMSAIRKVWRFSPERRAALKAAGHPEDRSVVLCHSCGQWVVHKLATVDHIEPVVPVTGFDSWDATIHRMRHNALAVLCDQCHAIKTKRENAERAANRKRLKQVYTALDAVERELYKPRTGPDKMVGFEELLEEKS